jgi:hypothetical protein
VFFIAPGMCGLIQSGRINGKNLRDLVTSHQPNARVVNIDDVSQAIPKLTEALGITSGQVKSCVANTSDWPFVD